MMRHQQLFGIVLTIIFSSLSTASLTLQAVQSSTAEQLTSDLAVDNDQSTCSMTGYGVDNWWKVDLGSLMTIKAVSINGSTPAAVSVRFGQGYEEYGARRGFDANPQCVTLADGVTSLNTFYCEHVVYGRYLSIQTVDNSVGRLVLCDVKVIVADPTSF